MTSMSSSDVSLWLHTLDRQKKDHTSLFMDDYQRLCKLAPIPTVRVIYNPEGEPRLFFIDRKKTIAILKELYGFHTKPEVTTQLREAQES